MSLIAPNNCGRMKKFRVGNYASRLGIWGVPLVSITVLPFLLANWQSTELSPTSPLPVSSLPPVSQLPTPSAVPPVPSQLTNLQNPVAKRQPLADPTPTQTPSSARKSAPTPTQTLSSLSKPPQKPKLAAAPGYQPPQLEIRVAVLRDAAGASLGVSGQATLADRDGRPLQTLSGSDGWWVEPDGASLLMGSRSLPGVVWVQPTADGMTFVGDRWYRGKILLVSQGNSLLAVNYVNLEDYLYSVVGSEMHSDAPVEALKAQAIAARSYALVHIIRPASPWYDLGNSQRWQVYKGVHSEYTTTQQAVNETAGQILSYQGGVVESLYAATDEIVSRAHGGRGMSQTGAYDLASQGQDYQQILDRYYPGVGLARLILHN